ncbi:unnamed protein product [Tilletia caries]|uniref:Uncharacterized protein n=1 Tax=Tilletia caries TaxID=13290 RepID=A0ABN7IPN6_9BASI|nr:unnamed protein product [Tilletia caries]
MAEINLKMETVCLTGLETVNLHGGAEFVNGHTVVGGGPTWETVAARLGKEGVGGDVVGMELVSLLCGTCRELIEDVEANVTAVEAEGTEEAADVASSL